MAAGYQASASALTPPTLLRGARGRNRPWSIQPFSRQVRSRCCPDRRPAHSAIARETGPPGTVGRAVTVAAITAKRVAHIYGTRPGPFGCSPPGISGWLATASAYQAPVGETTGCAYPGPRIRPMRATGRTHPGHRGVQLSHRLCPSGHPRCVCQILQIGD